MSENRPIIVIKKKGGHGGHHGGAWKVAYADFVTAMMSLFIVLWLLNSNKPVQEAVGGYFRDPLGTAAKKGTDKNGKSDDEKKTKDDMKELKEQIEKAMEKLDDFDKLKSQIEVTITPEGLRIDMLETESGTFFDVGSATLNKSGRDLLIALAKQFATIPNKLSLEGHTDSRPYSGKGNYSNWELSSDRANSARRLMQDSGVREDQVVQVRGFADQQPRDAKNPANASNRRVSIIVKYMEKSAQDEPADEKKADDHGSTENPKAATDKESKTEKPTASGGHGSEHH